MPDGTETALSPQDQKKADWIEDISGRILLSAQNVEMMNHRLQGKSKIDSLKDKKAGIRETLMSIEVKVKREEIGGRTKMKLLEGDGDYTKEIDTVHHAKLMKEALTPEQNRLVQAELDKVYAVRDELRGNPYYDPGTPPDFIDPVKPVYTEEMDPRARQEADAAYRAAVKERARQEAEWDAKVAECERHLTEDLWTPLVREGVLPENFVPQKNSEVASLFENAASLYDARLEEYSAEMTEADVLAGKFELGYKIGKSVLKLASSTTGVVGAFGELYEDDDIGEAIEIADEVFEYLDVALTLAETITPMIIKEKDFLGVGVAIAESVAGVIGSATDAEVAQIVSRMIQNGARGAKIGEHLSKTPPEYDEAFGAILTSICSELESNDPQEGGGLMSQLADNLSTAATAVSQGGVLAKMVAEKKSPAVILAAAINLAETIGNSAAGGTDDSEDEEDPIELDDMTVDIDEGLKALYAEKIDEEVLQAREAAMDAAAAEAVLRDAEATAEAEKAEMLKHLRMGFPLATDDQDAANQAEFERIQSIEYLIRMQKKNEATFNLCTQIADKGIKFVAKLFPPAGILQAALTLSLAIKSAVEQTQEMLIWRENVDDAMTAVSPQVDAMLNRSGLQTKQAMQAQVQVGLEAARVVAQVIALSPVAPAAPVIEAVTDATEAAIELADLIYTEVQLNAAWKLYQQARAVPEDRWLARKATRENPTLSKYAMAYGAMNNDPIAVEGMRRCGLNKQVLANPDTNISKVVTYLETKYADDPVLLRTVPAKDDWHPGTIELSASSWMQFYNAAIGDGGLDPDGDTSGIAAALGRLGDAEAAFSEALDDVGRRASETTRSEHKTNPVLLNSVAKDTLSLALMEVREKLDGYKPRKKDDSTPHKSMADYIDALRALSEKRSAAVNKIEDDAPWQAKLKKDAA